MNATIKFQKSIARYQQLRFMPLLIGRKRNTAMTHETAIERLKKEKLPYRNILESKHHPYMSERF